MQYSQFLYFVMFQVNVGDLSIKSFQKYLEKKKSDNTFQPLYTEI